MYLPDLYNGEPSFQYNEEWAERVYNECTFPALRDTFGVPLQQFPPSFQAEQFRAKRHSGKEVHSEFALSEDLLEQFSQNFFAKLRRKHYGREAFFLHQVRGAKGFGSFDPGDRETGDDVLSEVSAIFDQERFNANRVTSATIDVGFEIGLEGYVALIREAAHGVIVKKFLTSLEDECTDENAAYALESSYFESNETAMLTEACGFRYSPSYSNNDCEFLQAYNTEKNPTYLPDRGNFAKFLSPMDFLKLRRQGKTFIEHMEGLCDVFSDCAERHNSFPARIETRISLTSAFDTTIDQDFAKDAVYLIPNQVWW